MKYFDELKTAMSEIVQSFEKDELAYLALTSKIELPIRDRLAFYLYKKFWKDDIVVTREWLRTDLALLKDGKPLIICELKAGYTFDSIYNNPNYLDLIQRDIAKSKLITIEPIEIVSIFLTTHVHQFIDNKFARIIKYHGEINRALKQFENQEAVLERALFLMNENFKDFDIEKGEIKCGNAFNCHVDIHYWMFSEKATAV
jgi:hypothetical protein